MILVEHAEAVYVSAFATCVEQYIVYQLAHPCSLIMVCIVHHSVCINGSGYVEVRLKSYRNENSTDLTGKCCDSKGPSGCDPCDPYVEGFLSQGASVTNLSEIITTGLYNNTKIVNFGNSTGKINNPFKLTFVNFTNSLILALVAWDDDRYETTNKSRDKLEDLRFNVGQGEPSPFYTNPNFVVKVMKGKAVVLEFEYRILCDKNFYGNCNKFCKPKVGQYHCNTAGNKVCEPGWSGIECDTSPCQNNSCEHNSTCVPSLAGDYNCSCPPSYSGKMCDTKITPDFISTTQVVSKLATTMHMTSTRDTTSIRQEITSKPSDRIGIIVGCSVAAVCVIAALLALIICVFLKKQNDSRRNILPSTSS